MLNIALAMLAESAEECGECLCGPGTLLLRFGRSEVTNCSCRTYIFRKCRRWGDSAGCLRDGPYPRCVGIQLGALHGSPAPFRLATIGHPRAMCAEDGCCAGGATPGGRHRGHADTWLAATHAPLVRSSCGEGCKAKPPCWSVLRALYQGFSQG